MTQKKLDSSVLKKARRKANMTHKNSPTKPDWTSFLKFEKADDDFLRERPDVVDEQQFQLD